MTALLAFAEVLESDVDPLVPHPLSARPTLSAAAIIAGILNFFTDHPLIGVLIGYFKGTS
jgi:hypothetical protein